MSQGPSATEQDEYPLVRELTRPQRRVIGTLLEKGFTTPDQYPLTVKACTAGCNQKSNRDPISNYSEDQVFDLLDELRELGLVAIVHTESGRTERYRHYMRKRFNFTEPQLAILTELLLRGKQSLGELRNRASRMVAIDSLEELRNELQGMMNAGFVASNIELERRGAEVDHTFYPANEKRRSDSSPIATQTETEAMDVHTAPLGMPGLFNEGEEETRAELRTLRSDFLALQTQHSELQRQVESLQQVVDDLRMQLGG